MRNQVTTVPKRRPPSPHSCSRFRSPLRQRAAAKPSQVMKPKSNTKIINAIQSTCATSKLFLRGEIDDRADHYTEDHPGELIPVEERQTYPGGLNAIEERRPEHGGEFEHE